MKQKDIALILVIVVISVVLSMVISKKVFVTSANNQQAAQVENITTNFPQPDPNYFNINSIDPTQLIQVSPNNNSSPFSSSSQ